MVIVDWQLDQAAGHDEVMTLAKVLLQQGADLVAVCPDWVDFSEPAFEHDSRLPVDERWVQVREEIVVYRLDGDSDGG
jgi:hypothetical protein